MSQALVQDEVTVSLYYRSVKDDKDISYIVCFVCDGRALMSPFYHELDKYSDSLSLIISAAENIGDAEPYLDSW